MLNLNDFFKIFFRVEILLSIAFFSLTYYVLLQALTITSNRYEYITWMLGLPLIYILSKGLLAYTLSIMRDDLEHENAYPMLHIGHFIAFNRLTDPLIISYIIAYYLFYQLMIFLDNTPGISHSVNLLIAFLLPASLLSYTLESRIPSAFSITKILAIIFRFKFKYLLVLLLFSIATSSLFYLIEGIQYPSYLLILSTVLFLISGANYFRALVKENNQYFSIDNLDEQWRQKNHAREMRTLETGIYQIMKTHKYDLAISFIGEQIQTSQTISDKDVHEYLRESDYAKLEAIHAKHYLKRCTQGNNTQEFWNILLHCTEKYKNFFIDDVRIIDFALQHSDALIHAHCCANIIILYCENSQSARVFGKRFATQAIELMGNTDEELASSLSKYQ